MPAPDPKPSLLQTSAHLITADKALGQKERLVLCARVLRSRNNFDQFFGNAILTQSIVLYLQ